MIPNPDSQVKDFNTGEMVKRHSVKVIALNCAGCGKVTNHFDHLFGWHICVECNSDEVAADLADHVMNPNRGVEGFY